MGDKTTKILLALVAIGLWANIGVSLLKPTSVLAQNPDIATISHDVHAIYNGTCTNKKVC
jgi:hypothetical protein